MVYHRHANDPTPLDTLNGSLVWEFHLNNYEAETHPDAPLVDRFRWEYLNKEHDTDRLFEKALFRIVEDGMGGEYYEMVDKDKIKVEDEMVDEDEIKDVKLKDGGRARWLTIASWKDKDPAGANGYLKWIHDSTPYVGCDLVALQILCNEVYLADRPAMLPGPYVRPFAEYDPAAFLMSYAKVQNYKYYMLRKAAEMLDLKKDELAPTRPDDVQQMYESLHRKHLSTVSFVTMSFLDAINLRVKKNQEKEASYVAFYTVAFPGPSQNPNIHYPSISERYEQHHYPTQSEIYEQQAEAARFYINPFCDYIYGKFVYEVPLYWNEHTYDVRGPFVPSNVGFVRNDREFALAAVQQDPKNNGVFPNEKQADIFRQWHDLFWDKVLDNGPTAERAVVIDGDYLFYCSKRLREDFDLRLTAAKTSMDWAIIMCDDMLLDLTKGDIETNMQTTTQKARRSRVGRYFFGQAKLMPTPTPAEIKATTLEKHTSYDRALQTIAGSYNVTTDLERDPDDLLKLDLLLGKVENLTALLWHPCGSLHGDEKEAYERELQTDHGFVLAAVIEDGNALRYAADELKADPEIVLAAVQQNGYALRYAAEALRADPEIVTDAVTQNGGALLYADEKLKADREIVLAAVQQCPHALNYAADKLKSDLNIVRAALQKKNKRSVPDEDEEDDDDDDDDDRPRHKKSKKGIDAFIGIMHVNPMHVRWSLV
tara:strand:+ start:3869 stop:5998 length:2130 start_codon:yes stop_codon:yes gene_type:complete